MRARFDGMAFVVTPTLLAHTLSAFSWAINPGNLGRLGGSIVYATTRTTLHWIAGNTKQFGDGQHFGDIQGGRFYIGKPHSLHVAHYFFLYILYCTACPSTTRATKREKGMLCSIMAFIYGGGGPLFLASSSREERKHGDGGVSTGLQRLYAKRFHSKKASM